MSRHLKNAIILFVALVFLPVAWITIFTGPDLTREDLLEKRLAELRDRLHQAETLSHEREQDLHLLKHQLELLVNTHSHANGSASGIVHIPQETRDLLKNLTMGSWGGYGSKDIRPPGIFNYLPHLISKPEGLQPAFKLSQGRDGVQIVMGIPTIKRKRESYLMQTLQSLLQNLNQNEREQSLIVVYVGEIIDQNYAKEVAKQIEDGFKPEVEAGLIEVIAPPPTYFPDLDHLKVTFGDSSERVRWRTKQNLDFSFMMMYCRSKGTYYVQLEDDIVTKPGYLGTMWNFAINQKTDEWIILEFSHLGFIGKLFKASDLPMVVEFFLMFHKDKPIDWLLDHLLFVKVCNPEKDAKHCQRQVAQLRIRFKPSLFQHIGTHSSLDGKIQKLKDKDFGKSVMHRAHINPNAEVSTTLKHYQRYTLDRAYMGETFFWATLPNPGDVVLFKFNPPIKIESYSLRSGNPEHPGDKMYNTTVEVLLDGQMGQGGGVMDNKDQALRRTEDGFITVGQFNHGTGLAEGEIDPNWGPVNTLRLRVLTPSESWIIINEIHIKQRTKR